MPLAAGFFDAFVNPGLLAGLALLAAPIIIHILNKRHYTVIEWAAMDFLLSADQRNRRRLRIEDLLLLLARMALLAFFVFAVARPIVRGFGSMREAERIVVLDDSFSMDASGGAGTCFSAAREAAASQVEDAVGRSIPVSIWSGTLPEEGARDLVLAQGGASTSPDPSPGASSGAEPAAAASLLAAVRAMETTDLPLKFAAILGKLAERIAAKKDGDARSVVLVSDFRAPDWFEEGGLSLRSDLAAAFLDMKKLGALEATRFRFVDVGGTGGENCAVTAVRLTNDPPFAKVPTRIVVEVTNFGAEDRKRVTGDLEVGLLEPPAGKEKATLRVLHRAPLPAIEVIPAGKTASTQVEFTFEKAGKFGVIARVEADRLPRDDVSHLVVDVRDGLRAVVVDGDPGEGRFSGESGFLLAALAPRGVVPSGILPRRFVGELTPKDLVNADVVVILNRAGVLEKERGVLEDFVRKGGGVAFFLGDKVAPDRYRDLAFFPAAIQPLRDAPARARLRLGEPTHAAFEPFRGVEGSSLEQVGFDKFFGIEPKQGVTVAARFNDGPGTPAILEGPVEKGRAAIFNMSADRDWNDWPTDPSYPIALQEWVRYLAPKRAKAATFTAGEPLAWDLSAGVRYSVALPDGRVEEVKAASASSPLTYARTRKAGFYCVLPARALAGSEVAAEALEPAWFACRRSARESSLEPAREERLRAALAPAGVEFSMGRDLSADVFQRTEEGETWRAFAWAAGFFLLFELALAWFLSQRK